MRIKALNVRKLRRKLKKDGISQISLIRKLGIPPSTGYLLFKDGKIQAEYAQPAIRKIAKALGTQPGRIAYR